jgi:cyanophycinase-like exopeptidase
MLSDTMSLARGSGYGIGVDENTALVVTQADTEQATGEVCYLLILYGGQLALSVW